MFGHGGPVAARMRSAGRGDGREGIECEETTEDAESAEWHRGEDGLNAEDAEGCGGEEGNGEWAIGNGEGEGDSTRGADEGRGEDGAEGEAEVALT